MKGLILLLASMATLPAYAQAPSSTRLSDSTIQVTVVPQGRYSQQLYTVNHEPLTGSTLKSLLQRYPPSAAELHKGGVQRAWGFALLPVMVVAFVVSKHQADQAPGPGSAFSKAPVPVSILLGVFLGYGYLLLSSDHYGRAIELYNQRFH